MMKYCLTLFLSLLISSTVFAAPAIEYNQEKPDSVVHAIAVALISGEEDVVNQLYSNRPIFMGVDPVYDLYDKMSDIAEKNLVIKKDDNEGKLFSISNNAPRKGPNRLGTYDDYVFGEKVLYEDYMRVALRRVGKRYVIESIICLSRNLTPEPVFEFSLEAPNLKRKDLNKMNPLE